MTLNYAKSTCKYCLHNLVVWCGKTNLNIDTSFCGLSRNRRVSHTAVLESDAPYWIYRYERPERPGKWTKILPYETSPTSPSPLPVETPSPLPRYAHQVVYDPLKKIVYMHGGNAGLESEILVHSYDYDGSARDRDRDRDGGDDIRTQSPGAHREVRSPAPLGGEGSDGEKENRLDDFWRMKLIRYDLGTLLLHSTQINTFAVGPRQKTTYVAVAISSDSKSRSHVSCTSFRYALIHFA